MICSSIVGSKCHWIELDCNEPRYNLYSRNLLKDSGTVGKFEITDNIMCKYLSRGGKPRDQYGSNFDMGMLSFMLRLFNLKSTSFICFRLKFPLILTCFIIVRLS